MFLFVLFVWFLNVLVNYQVISRAGPKTERFTILIAATHETQPFGSGRPQQELNPGPPHQVSRPLPTELPRPLLLTSEVI